MTFREQLTTIKRLDSLIGRKATGDAGRLAQKLDLSKASVYRYLDTMKDLGAPIAYCKQRKSYYYTDPDYRLNL